MTQELTAIMVTAAGIGLLHTLLGPDHYVPFVALARANGWSYTKAILITVLCGLGHVLSSAVLGLIGVIFGVALMKLEGLESFRGNLAGWAFTAFGLMYLVWGLRRAYRKRRHKHSRKTLILNHNVRVLTEDENLKRKSNTTPWILFTIFVLGPCEPLIPILMYPASQSSLAGMLLVATVFSIVTIATMVAVVTVLMAGIKIKRMNKLERFSHALAGLTIFLCGVAIQFGL